ncbi:MAG TPA: nuclear transport factor 2 family protein [Candidatus Dormibacteraeota bacterium]|jgi:hypothetical protein|nr:nuclear transport factor 2 family protein [Candidatus Dormibacteraeota bacterium]
MGRDAFRLAAEAGDMDALAAALDQEVHFRGPAFGTADVVGRERVMGILKIAFEKVYRDFSYVESLDNGDRCVLLFTSQVGEHAIEGAQVLRFGDHDLVVELVVMARPAPGAAAIGEEIVRHLDYDPREEG